MESFLIQIQDMLQRSNQSKVLVLGNGASQESGWSLIKSSNEIPFVSINRIEGTLTPLFVLATSREAALNFDRTLNKKVPIVVSESLGMGTRFTSIPVSQTNYIEGSEALREEIEYRQDFVLLTILKILNRLVLPIDKIRVELYGFDFSSPKALHQVGNSFLDLILERQKSIFLSLHKKPSYLPKLEIENAFVSYPEYSVSYSEKLTKETPNFTLNELSVAIEKNNSLMNMRLDEASNGQIQIVAELTNNHLGDTIRLGKMVVAAKNQGATIIKIQKRDPDTLYTQEELESEYISPFGNTLSSYRKGVELSEGQIDYLTILCANLEIPWFTSVLDIPSLQFIEKYKPVAIKVPSTISSHRNFLKEVAKSKVPCVFASLGGTDEKYVEWLGKVFSDKKLILMQCTSSYPARPEDCNIRVIPRLQELSNHPDLILGYSSHDPGSLGCQLAISLGAKFIEKHTKLGSVDWIHFDGVALDLLSQKFESFTQALWDAEKTLGVSKKVILETEHHKYTPNDRHN
jgi:N-acetylneuraminate synthase